MTAADLLTRADRGRPRPAVAWTVRFRRPGVLVALAILLIAVACALVPSWFTTADPINGSPADRLQPPGAAHPFGTDYLGRDQLSRVVHGARLSLEATGAAVLIAAVAGGLIGVVAGYVGGLLDSLLMRLMDVLLAIPGLLLALAVVSAIGFGVVNVAVAVGVVSVAGYARLVRSQVLVVREAGYVTAARGSGARTGRILLTHVLPNSTGPLIALATVDIGAVLLTVSALSFLGFGAAPPTPEWGALVASGQQYLYAAWWLTTFPGLAIAAVVVSANRVARALEGR
ncbi:ABC transporter permease [Flexivirga sp. ID2601S]|uniref:ABC transporter permease n=1 Tax=Flexivirga aerilata TaxID=1656889 RepID=A0A849AEN8_9MICO|nr:ABC transporter permease [Flexivirga aerilata]NNG38283.1 ABC transporter permease [Flexivirga aerilata]